MWLQVGCRYDVPGYAVDIADTRLCGGCQETHGLRRLHRQGVSSARAQAQQVLKTLSNSRHTREEAIRLFGSRLREDKGLFSSLWTLSGSRHVCHCRLTQACHADAIIGQFHSLFPTACDRDATTSCPPSARVLAYLLKLREEPPSDGGSWADEGGLPAGAGWRGTGSQMMIGSAYTSRESCWVPHALTVRVGRPSPPCSWLLLAESSRQVFRWSCLWVVSRSPHSAKRKFQH